MDKDDKDRVDELLKDFSRRIRMIDAYLAGGHRTEEIDNLIAKLYYINAALEENTTLDFASTRLEHLLTRKCDLVWEITDAINQTEN